MYKKILSAVMALLVVAGAGAFVPNVKYDSASLTASAEDYREIFDDTLKYRIYEDHVAIVECNKEAKSVKVPEVISDLPVTEIYSRAFAYCDSLTAVTLPDSIEKIGVNAFYNCTNLNKITIPDGVSIIENMTFCNCTNLKSVTLPQSVTEIADEAFMSCENLEEINLPDGIEHIGFYAFTYCEKLSKVTIPKRMTEIGDYVFFDCSGMTELNLHDDVKKIGEGTFAGCRNLTEATIPESVVSIGEYAFFDCASLKKITILNPECEIDDSMNTITSLYDDIYDVHYDGVICGYANSTAQAYAETYGYAFEPLEEKSAEDKYEFLSYKKYSDHIVITGCDNSAQNVEVPAEIDKLPVTEIDDQAFSECSELTKITLPDSIEKIGERAFESCRSLTDITIPENVKSIGGSAFFNCSDLKSATIPKGVTEISSFMFAECSSLTDVNIPDSVKKIDDAGFLSCRSLKKITIPESVDSIGEYAFAGCEKLEKIAILNSECEIYNTMYTITNSQFTAPDTFYTGVICGYPNSTAMRYALRWGYEFVSYTGEETDGVYEGLTYRKYDDHVSIIKCDKLAESVEIPEKLEGLLVTEIERMAFYNCPELTSVTIPDTVKRIGFMAFAECPNLSAMTILNPECEISDEAAPKYKGVIRGYEKSTAQAYAETNDYAFEAVGSFSEQQQPVKYGDANCDGIVSIADATAILQHLGNKDKYALSEQGEINADVAEPAGITANDAIAIQQLDAGLIEKLPE